MTTTVLAAVGEIDPQFPPTGGFGLSEIVSCGVWMVAMLGPFMFALVLTTVVCVGGYLRKKPSSQRMAQMLAGGFGYTAILLTVEAAFGLRALDRVISGRNDGVYGQIYAHEGLLTAVYCLPAAASTLLLIAIFIGSKRTRRESVSSGGACLTV